MKEQIENRIQETMNSIDNLQRATANPFLYGKIRHKLQAKSAEVPVHLSLRISLALGVVMIINVLTIRHIETTYDGNHQGADLVAKEYNISLPQSY